MATKKSDTFFIRAKVTTADTSYAVTEIDLGAFVDALGQSVLRIHSVSTQYLGAGSGFPWAHTAAANNTFEQVAWNLTTQLQSSLVDFTDKSLVASGSLATWCDNANAVTTGISEVEDMNPSKWEGGYLIATESIYLGIDSASTLSAECDFCIMLECNVEKLSKEAALALALSQQ